MFKNEKDEPSIRKSTEATVRQKRLKRRSIVSLIVLTSGIGIAVGFRGVYAAGVHKTEFDSGMSCTAQYNAKLMEAKSALIRGERADALDALVAAKNQLGRCQEREQDTATHSVAVSLNLFKTGDSSGLV